MEKKTRYLQAAGRRRNRVETPPPPCARFSLHSNMTNARNNPQELTSDLLFTSRNKWDRKSLHPRTNQIQHSILFSLHIPNSASGRWRARRLKFLLKGKFTVKWKFCHHLVALILFQTCINVFVLLNIWKNVWDQTVDGPPYYGRQWCLRTT